MNEYREYLAEELENAKEAFEKAKKNAIEEIERMSPIKAEDFGAAYCSHIDKITSAAAKIRSINDSICAYDYIAGKAEN